MPTAATTTIPAVELAKVGEWNAMTSDGKPWVITEGDIADAVSASKDPVFRVPVVKLGHTDDRFTSGDGAFGRDGNPAVGRVTNIRASVDGQTLLGDLTGVPKWLADIIPNAYPSRSIEADLGVSTSAGRSYRMVTTGLALLGETAPAIKSLADIAALFDTSTEVEAWAAARHVTASLNLGATMPKQPDQPTSPAPASVLSSARVDEVWQAGDAFVQSNDTLPSDSWLRELYTDFAIFSDWKGRLWQSTWTEKDGEFAFGEPTPVKITYTALAKTSASHVSHAIGYPLHYERGREAVTVRASQGAPSVDITPAMREALGVDENADEAAVLAAIQAKSTPAAPPAPEPAPVPDPVEPPAPPVAPAAYDPDAVQELVAASVKQQISAATAPLLQQVSDLSGQLAARNQREAADTKAQVISSAVQAGKIRPADRASWEARYDKAPEVTSEILAALAEGTAVPVSTSGYSGSEARDDVDSIVEGFEAMLGGGR